MSKLWNGPKRRNRGKRFGIFNLKRWQSHGAGTLKAVATESAKYRAFVVEGIKAGWDEVGVFLSSVQERRHWGKIT